MTELVTRYTDKEKTAYRFAVVLDGVNDLIRQGVRELGWLSKHSEASLELYEVFKRVEQYLTHYLHNEGRLRREAPKYKEAVLEFQLELLRARETTVELALPRIAKWLQDTSNPVLESLLEALERINLVILSPGLTVTRRKPLPVTSITFVA